jgi:choloylglycine hydrolase
MCTRIFFNKNGYSLTSRTVDWSEDMQAQLYLMPKNISKKSYINDSNALSWKSKYASVGVFLYGRNYADGMNEAGLVMNVLYLAEADYDTDSSINSLSISQYGEFILDNFSSVSEAIDYLSMNRIRLIPFYLPNGRSASIHVSLSDKTGDSAILEYIDGKLVINNSKDYRVMTNSPQFSEQISLSNYWKDIDGMKFLPGSVRSEDRFIRASFLLNSIPDKLCDNYINALNKKTLNEQIIFSVLGVIRTISVPLGIMDPEKPNISSTLFRTLSDSKNLKYYFESATCGSMFWIDFDKIDFDTLDTYKIIEGIQHTHYYGDVTDKFVACEDVAGIK